MPARFRVQSVNDDSITGLVLEGIIKKGMVLKTNDGSARVALITLNLFSSHSMMSLFLRWYIIPTFEPHPDQVGSGSQTVKLTLIRTDDVSIREGDIEFHEVPLTGADEDMATMNARDRDILINKILLFTFLFSLIYLIHFLNKR